MSVTASLSLAADALTAGAAPAAGPRARLALGRVVGARVDEHRHARHLIAVRRELGVGRVGPAARRGAREDGLAGRRLVAGLWRGLQSHQYWSHGPVACDARFQNGPENGCGAAKPCASERSWSMGAQLDGDADDEELGL